MRWVNLLVPAVAWVAASRFLAPPLLRSAEERGDYLFGLYHLEEAIPGVPLALIALGLTLVCGSPKRARRWSYPIASVLLVVTSLVLAFDLVWTLGVLGAWKPAYWLDQGHITRVGNTTDPELGFRRLPGASWEGRVTPEAEWIHYRTDERGFRNPPGIARAEIAFVGDSYTEASQVREENTFVRRVGAALDASVVNLGLGAYGPQQELIVLRRHALALEPKVVVWQLFEGNDLSDAEQFLRWREDPDRPVSTLLQRYAHNSLLRMVLEPTARGSSDFPLVRLPLPDGGELVTPVRYGFRYRDASARPEGVAALKEALAEGHALLAERGIRLVVLLLPTFVHTFAPRLAFDDPEAAARYLPADRHEREDLADVLRDFCAERGIPFVEALEALRAAGADDPRGLYVPADEHLGVRGHEVVAGLLVEAIRDLESGAGVTGGARR